MDVILKKEDKIILIKTKKDELENYQNIKNLLELYKIINKKTADNFLNNYIEEITVKNKIIKKIPKTDLPFLILDLNKKEIKIFHNNKYFNDMNEYYLYNDYKNISKKIY